jgi:TRAP-type mannitol/chloroaromatic compound transport system permease large subunit
MLVVIYILYILARGAIRPQDVPPAPGATRPTPRQVAGAIVPPVLLIVAVLGAILGGIATPTEAASVGAIGAILMAGRRQGANRWLILAGVVALLTLAVAAGVAPVRLQRSDIGLGGQALGAVYAGLALIGIVAILAALWRAHRNGILGGALTSTMTVTAMIFATILTASIFSLVFVGLGGEERVAAILEAMPGGPMGALLFSMALIFVLGFFLDFVEITVIVLPLVAPVLILMGHDPVWLAILIAINLQTSFLTPPFGFSHFYLRGAAPPEITTGQIYAGVAPFILLQILGVAVVWLVPAIATWLPSAVF